VRFLLLVTRTQTEHTQNAMAFWIWVRILRAGRWELAHDCREQKSSPKAKFPND
jgi:hypothetical protein